MTTKPILTATKNILPGLLMSIVIALAAVSLTEHYGGPVMLMALLLGMALNFLSEEGKCVVGIDFAAKRVLQLGVVLLGLRITYADMVDLGLTTILLTCAGVLTTIVCGLAIARVFGLSRNFGLLTGGAVAICGASAAMAISAVLPNYENKERDTIFTVVAVTTLSTLAMVLYPLIVSYLGFDHRSAGIFLGGTIHDVAQVVGAGYTVSTETGDVGTLTKMLRVALLVPVVSLVYWTCHKKGTSKTNPLKSMPIFLVGFVLLAVVNSFGWVPEAPKAQLIDLSRGILITAIAALGMKSSLKQFAAVGRSAIALVVVETIFLATLFAVSLS